MTSTRAQGARAPDAAPAGALSRVAQTSFCDVCDTVRSAVLIWLHRLEPGRDGRAIPSSTAWVLGVAASGGGWRAPLSVAPASTFSG
jgi:hypothetical protein